MSELSHLDQLEAEAIYIIREVAASCEKPVMLYSIGKDSSVMLHLALKAFYPEKPPFPFLHVNTTWKFKEMIEFRDKIAKEKGIIFHTDCVQAVGNVKIDVKELGIDLLSLSSHKFYGPKGVGAIYINENVEFEKIQDGGHQEKNKRAGTDCNERKIQNT